MSAPGDEAAPTVNDERPPERVFEKLRALHREPVVGEHEAPRPQDLGDAAEPRLSGTAPTT